MTNAETIDTAPIARVKVWAHLPPSVTMYAPTLPPGEHDLWCVPVSAEAELAALRARVAELGAALREIAGADYRGNRSPESQIAWRALQSAGGGHAPC